MAAHLALPHAAAAPAQPPASARAEDDAEAEGELNLVLGAAQPPQQQQPASARSPRDAASAEVERLRARVATLTSRRRQCARSLSDVKTHVREVRRDADDLLKTQTKALVRRCGRESGHCAR